jgi:hypothetical protein
MHIPQNHYRVLTWTVEDPVNGTEWPHEGYANVTASTFNAHADGDDNSVAHCLTDMGDRPDLGAYDCTACAVEEGIAVMVRWDTDGDLGDGRELGHEIRKVHQRRVHAIAQHRSQVEPALSELAVAHLRIQELEKENANLKASLERMVNADWRLLDEHVTGHNMLLMCKPHEDGRLCAYHHRLGVWTFDGTKECLRDHPSVASLMERTSG